VAGGGPGWQVAGINFQVSGLGLRVSGSGIQVQVRVPGLFPATRHLGPPPATRIFKYLSYPYPYPYPFAIVSASILSQGV